jgi:hypothetical protein
MTSDAGQAWFVAGTVPLMLGGGLHAVAALIDAFRPTYFTPIERSVKPAAEGTGIRLRQMFPGGSGARPSMWSVWLGIHVSHGLGILAFALLCLLIATHDFSLVGSIGGLRPMTIAFSATLLALSFRFWFYGPALLTGAATLCFTVSAALA